jgi:hypothetical protein
VVKQKMRRKIYKEGQEKDYFFAVSKRGSVEVLGLCLNYLLEQHAI